MSEFIKEDAEMIKSNWYLWFFPVIALGICGWLAFDYLQNRGPDIRIHFEEGNSLQAEKTRIRFRGVDIGVVKNIEISEDHKEVIAYASLKKEAKKFAAEGTKFWIVSPKVTFQGISGLETLIEGTYIAALPGKEGSPLLKDFKGKMTEDSETLSDSVSYILETSRADSVNPGNSVTFRGLKIGSVNKVDLNKTAQLVRIHISIEKKFVRLIRENTVFWNKVAVQANLGLFKSSLKIESLDALLRGGIECFTPDSAGTLAKAQSTFPLAAEAPKGYEKWNPKLEF